MGLYKQLKLLPNRVKTHLVISTGLKGGISEIKALVARP